MGRDSEDSTIYVTWKTLPIVVAFAAVLLAIIVGTPAQQSVVIKVSIVAVGLIWGYFLLRFLFSGGLFRRHPASEIARLIGAKQYDQARETATQLLRQHPDDPMVQLNAVAAFHFSGDAAKACTTFQQVDRKQLPHAMRPAYDDWNAKYAK